MKIAILTLAPFPEGLAITNRVFYYAKGLIENGIEAKVYIVKPTEISGKVVNHERVGEYKGVPYEYTVNCPTRSSSFLARRYYDTFGPVKALKEVLKNNYDAAILVSSDSFYHTMLFKVLRMFGVKYCVERTELMFHAKKVDGVYKYLNEIFKRIIYKNLNVFFTISHVLVEEFSKVVSRKTPVVLIPVIVDEKDIYKPEVERTEHLVYTGPLIQRKDGILTIIESFNRIASDHPNTNLLLTGDINMSWDKEKILALLENNPFKDRIIFKGFVSRVEMIEMLNSAVGLVLAKPSGDQSDTCFPTKLGEYMASGNPIIVTSTGEIPLYLTDGINAYIAEPDSIESYTDKLRELLLNRDKAREIGKQGRITAMEKFNYIEISKKVIKAINSSK